VVAAWGAITGAVQLVPLVGGPTWVVEAVVAVAAIGLPIACVVAWMFEATSEGLIRDRGDTDWNDAVNTEIVSPHGVVRATWRDVQSRAHHRILDQPFSIGRDASCAIRFDDPLVSRHHVEIGLTDGAWYVADLESRNGTLLDGVVIKRAPLPNRCRIQLSAKGPAIDLELRASAGATTALAPPR
jgi:hypothetical protein